ncbi:MAG: hypothetical protein RI985_1453 [Chloroflexota bacterium]
MRLQSLRVGISISLLLGMVLWFPRSFISSYAQPTSIPQVWSITPDTSVSYPDDALFTVTFNNSVTGVDPSDFYTAGDNNTARIQQVDATSNQAVYRVHVSRNQPSSELLLVLSDDDSIIGLDATPLGGIGAQNGNAISTAHIDTTTTIAASAQTTRRPRAGGIEVGYYASMALTTTDAPIISHYDDTNRDLKLAICGNAVCANPTTTVIDSTGVVGHHPSIALSTTNVPFISYYDGTNGDLKLAICNNSTTCNNPTLVQVDTEGNVGSASSIALNAAGIPFISYYDATNGDLKLAICNNKTTCDSPTRIPVDTVGNVGDYTSIALNAAGIPFISYFDLNNGDLKLAICNNSTTCDDPELVLIESLEYVGTYSSIELTSAGIPVISYADETNTDLKLVICNDAIDCDTPVIKALDSTGVVGYYSSLALDANDIAHVSYIDDANGDLKLAICSDAYSCATNTTSIIDSAGMVGYYTAIAINSAGTPVISYQDGDVYNLKLYHGMQVIDRGQPNTFGKAAPANNAGQSSTTATLTWNSVSNATSYEYCISTSATSCTSWTSTGSATTATVSGLSYATYYWQVRATNGAGTTLANNNTPWRLTIAQLPAAFAKSAPANNATNQKTSVTLSWAASTRATSYEYCIALSTSACTNWKSVGTKRTATVTGLTKNKAYYWQVRAKNAGGTTLSSTTFWKFTTAR